jgi:Putative transposase
VLDYVERYTHRVAISNNRLLDIEDGHVTFRWKDYRDGDTQKTMTLTTEEFIRRFLLHVLPPGYSVSATTASWAIVIGRRSSSNVAGFCK